MKKILSSILTFILITQLSLPALCSTKTAENNYIKAQQVTRHLHSRLSKKYTGYDYTIKNIYTQPVTIRSISIWDNASSKIAYLSVKRTGVRAAAETLGTGLALALPTLTISLIDSAVAVPFIIIGNQFGNVGAKRESKRYDKIPDSSVILAPNQEIKIKTMALRLHSPSMRIIFVNPLTDEDMNIEFK